MIKNNRTVEPFAPEEELAIMGVGCMAVFLLAMAVFVIAILGVYRLRKENAALRQQIGVHSTVLHDTTATEENAMWLQDAVDQLGIKE